MVLYGGHLRQAMDDNASAIEALAAFKPGLVYYPYIIDRMRHASASTRVT